MASLWKIEQALERLFRVNEWEKDPGFSRFIPMVYDPLGFLWQDFFEPEFTNRFNGFMLRGREEVNTVFLAVFPTDEVLDRFIAESSPGDLLFMHHPLVMECGDPRGQWGRGFLPINWEHLEAIRAKELSVYTCHLPMDTSREIGTTSAMAEALGAEFMEPFWEAGNGHAGMICQVQKTTTDELIDRLTTIFDIPYVDLEGKRHDSIERIAIVAGCGDVVEAMREAESCRAQAYITGEIHCHIDNEYGRRRYQQMMEYVPSTAMSLIGVSHAASEYLVMKTQMQRWFLRNFPVEVVHLPQRVWWK